MMAEGQGNGHDSPEGDNAWQPSPPPEADPGTGTPEPDTEPGEADPGTSWLPFKMTSPAEDAAQAAPAQPAAVNNRFDSTLRSDAPTSRRAELLCSKHDSIESDPSRTKSNV